MGYLLLTVLFVLLYGNASHETQTEILIHNFSCQFWSHYSFSSHQCECDGNVFFIVYCESNAAEVDVSVLVGYCMTIYSKEALVGACPYYRGRRSLPYTPVPKNLTELDRVFCRQHYRTGQLCAQCVDGYSPPVYSYYIDCVKCKTDINNWPKYLAVSLVPTTAFFLVVIILRFRATSPQMNGYILFCQVITSPSILKSALGNASHNKHQFGIPGDLYIAFLSIWNLDFFRASYKSFCLHPNASTLQVLSLDYITAVYPLVLIVFTYTLVTLHYKNYKLVVWMWRPFIGCFARCRRQWDIQNSLVDAFATFLLLSYVKFFSVSLDLLTPTILWNSSSKIQHVVLYYNGSVEYFGSTHIPYAILAISVLGFFTMLPILLLCLYPCRCFQRFLNIFHMNSQTLHHFMDAFQGCFKDGTNGTKDCRYFVSIYFITRVLMHLGFIVTNNTFSTIIQTTVLQVVVILLVCFQPYKKYTYTIVDTVFLLTLCIVINSVAKFHNGYVHSLSSRVNHLYILAAPVPIVYPLYLVLRYTVKRTGMSKVVCIENVKTCCSRFRPQRNGEASALLRNRV